MKTAKQIIENFNPIGVKHEIDSNNEFCSVQIKDQYSGLCFWVDISVNEEYKDVNVDWNQYIFYLLNEDHVLRKEIQEDCNCFDLATSEAIRFAEENNFLKQDDKGNWFRVVN
jgi:hypothetical protein